MKIKQSAEKLRTLFLDLIFPIECLGCGVEGRWLCGDCFKKINLKSGQYCLHCKTENDFGRFCPPCRIIYFLDGVWIASLYDDPLIGRAIKYFKYHFIFSLGLDLSALMSNFVLGLLERSRLLRPALAGGLDRRDFDRTKNIPLALLDFRESLIIPVPLSPKRLRWRGFNQAEILARELALGFGLEMNSRDLVRIKHKKPQAKLSEAGRLENVKNCFAWRGSNLKRRNVILIDDVVTTGATLNECAKTLKAAGAGEVWGLVVAKG